MPHSRQVTEELSPPGRLHSHQLVHVVYLKADNATSSENQWLFRKSFSCIFPLYDPSPLLLNIFYVSLTIISRCAPEESKHTKLYIWSMFTWVKRTFGTGNPNRVTWLPVRFMHLRTSIYFLVHFTRTCVIRQENSMGADGESLLTA